ncbi:ATP-dependent acyl-CoA ligase [Trinickia violacea]|uniref:ATP-dependent acyl-CoA ligase n=1 Tax=Trinickia violacea TaxID=2571746 RepID=A0A4P8ISV4_9BURK|nr:AMP-binding protein [Trinickia violacea]QCP50363.1 ATP-dependent acyl-CoA ligase [Trinickia violacea]
MATIEIPPAESILASPPERSSYCPGPRDTVVHALARAEAKNPDRIFIDLAGTKYSYREIDRLSTRLAHALAALGVQHGDRVVSLLDTSIDVFTTWFAANKLGAIWVPINTAYQGEFLRHQISDSGTKLIVCDAHYLERIVAIADQLPEVQLVLSRGPGPFPSCPIAIAPLDEHRGNDEAPLPVVVKPADLATLLYTSGTTGPSKGCMMSHNYLCMQGRQQNRCVQMTAEDVQWTCLPVFHGAALISVLGCLVEGLRCAIWPRFSVSSFWSDLEQAGATKALLMASIFPLVAHAPDTEAMKRYYGRLDMISGVPITPEVRKIWKERFGVRVVSSWSYGQTEGVRLSMVGPDEIPPEGCAGRVADEFEVMIFDADDNPLPDGQVGEIVFRPREPNIMFEGYWKRPEETLKVWRNLWMHTGDLGRLENGYLYFVDRAKDYLRCRGENISSFEIERAFSAHPDIAELAVHAVGRQSGEDEVKATIVLREGATVTHVEMCHWAIEKLPYFAVPRYFEFRAELVKNPTGRVLKYRLREEGVTSGTWDREAAGIEVRRRK